MKTQCDIGIHLDNLDMNESLVAINDAADDVPTVTFSVCCIKTAHPIHIVAV